MPMPWIPFTDASPNGPRSTLCQGRNRTIRYTMPAPSRILLAVESFERSNPPDWDMTLLSRRPRGRASERNYGTPCLRQSQTFAGSRRGDLRRASNDAAAAIAPAPSATHGPQPGRRERRRAGDREDRAGDREERRDRPGDVPRPRMGAAERPRGGDQKRGGDREGGEHRPARVGAPGAERLRARSEPAPRQDGGQSGDHEGDPGHRSGGGSRLARCDLRDRGVLAERAREALGAERAAANRDRAREAHRAAAGVAHGDRRARRVHAASLASAPLVDRHERRVRQPFDARGSRP